MAQGLRKHWGQYYESDSYIEYDKYRKCDKKISVLRCMICGREKYEYSFLPHEERKEKVKALEKNRNRYHA